jgi:hypothetical protein
VLFTHIPYPLQNGFSFSFSFCATKLARSPLLKRTSKWIWNKFPLQNRFETYALFKMDLNLTPAWTTFVGIMIKLSKWFGRGSVIMVDVLGLRLETEFVRFLTPEFLCWSSSTLSGWSPLSARGKIWLSSGLGSGLWVLVRVGGPLALSFFVCVCAPLSLPWLARVVVFYFCLWSKACFFVCQKNIFLNGFESYT